MTFVSHEPRSLGLEVWFYLDHPNASLTDVAVFAPAADVTPPGAVNPMTKISDGMDTDYYTGSARFRIGDAKLPYAPAISWVGKPDSAKLDGHGYCYLNPALCGRLEQLLASESRLPVELINKDGAVMFSSPLDTNKIRDAFAMVRRIVKNLPPR